ncbi:uncharacterized protein SPSK_05453 [Sporothrix schenckii 1099-18]|uniref:Mitochondrial fission process protein 1 n=2 Tax=Sporothrix schenckii TaxID=29908 RepID=U7Q679_SPOS1|nr:uncharacterized protein SPSK_05453 [Sporothrix schenckii 1099-18]ERT02515.1 hypothetical protein HMPREF1624_00814 [Sporothrix schenckii ATCC 58251]KJR80201.1 hypothetical protein SPSK_05453 [Sporothrix schenckii 1099-18]
MFWGKGPDKPSETAGKVAGSSTTADTDNIPAPKSLPRKLQKMVDEEDKEDNFYDELVSGYVPESTDSKVRYAAYAARLRTILLSAHRYVAYTSDIGESFRPVAHPLLVRGAYGISWAYILGDVSYEGYKAYLHNQRVLNPTREFSERQKRLVGVDEVSDPFVRSTVKAGAQSSTATPPPALQPGVVTPLEDYRVVMLQRTIFQSIASMGLPAFTIHSVVRYSGRALKDMKNKTIRTWAPIGLGLAVVPFLPTLFDKPVENAVEFVFHKAFAHFGGQQAVGESPVIGREKQLNKKLKEKEL